MQKGLVRTLEKEAVSIRKIIAGHQEDLAKIETVLAICSPTGTKHPSMKPSPKKKVSLRDALKRVFASKQEPMSVKDIREKVQKITGRNYNFMAQALGGLAHEKDTVYQVGRGIYDLIERKPKPKAIKPVKKNKPRPKPVKAKKSVKVEKPAETEKAGN